MTQDYIRHFGKPQTELKHIFSPYRVCPIGAHVDHQHGLVTGFAIDKGVDLVYTATEDGSVSLRSLTFEGDIDFSVLIHALVKQGNWGDYARSHICVAVYINSRCHLYFLCGRLTGQLILQL